MTTIAVKDSSKSIDVKASKNKAQVKESAPLKNALSKTVIDAVNGSSVTPNASSSVSASETSKPKRSYANFLKKNARDKTVIDAANGSSVTPNASSSVSASETSKPKRSYASFLKKNARDKTVINAANNSSVTPNASSSMSASETSKPKRFYASFLKKNARDKTVINAANNSSVTPNASSSVSASETSKPKKSFKKDDMIDRNGSSAQKQTTSVDTTPEKQKQNDLFSTLNVVQNYYYDPNTFRIGEFLSNYQMDKHTVSLIPRGLTNCKNYCYINSILQALLACPSFYNLLMAMPISQDWSSSFTFSPLTHNMTRFVREFAPMTETARLPRTTQDDSINKRGDNAVVDIQSGVAFEPSYIYTMFRYTSAASIFSQDGQEDAEEYLSCLLNGINDEMSEVMGSKSRCGAAIRHTELERTPLSDIFRGQLRSSISRAGEQQPTDNIQPFFTLQLDVHEADSVRSAFEFLTRKEQLEGMWCSETSKRIEAWKQVTLEELPVILILHLKWFVYKFDKFSDGCSKIFKSIEFPVDLKIDEEYLSPDTMKKLNPKEKQYKLFAVTYHDGKEMINGHYVTDAFHVGYGSWIRYNDNSVKGVSESDVLRPTSLKVPYLIYYRRCDTICDN